MSKLKTEQQIFAESKISVTNVRLIAEHFGYGAGPFTAEQVKRIKDTARSAQSEGQTVKQFLQGPEQVFEVPDSGSAGDRFSGAAGAVGDLIQGELALTHQQSQQIATQLGQAKAKIIGSIPAMSDAVAAEMLEQQNFQPSGVGGALRGFKFPEVRVAELAGGHRSRALSGAKEDGDR